MAYQHRPLRADDLDQAWRLDLQLFNEASTHRDAFDGLSEPERFQGVFDEKGRLVAMARVIPYGQYFGGRRVSMGGLSSVGVAPEARGRGLGVAVTQAALADMRAHGEVISTLFPATTGLYRKLGWELSGAFVIRHVACAALRNLSIPDARRIERAEPSDLPRIQACYEKIAPTVNGFLDRPASSWFFLEKIWDDFFVYLSLDGSGELDGYVAYDQLPQQRGEIGYTIRVREWMATSRNALSSLFWTLGSASTVASTVRYKSSPEDPLLLLVDHQVQRVQWDVRIMTRIVDPKAAVAERGFAPSLELDVPLVLEEASEQKHGAAYRLLVSKGEGRLEPADGDDPGAPCLGIGAFASLYTGWAQTEVLERAGLLAGGSGEQRAALDAAFAGPTAWIPEEF